MGQRNASSRVDGLEQAVEAILLDLQPRMERILWHYRIPAQDAEDLVQEIFVSFVRRYETVENPEAWLVLTCNFSTVMNTFLPVPPVRGPLRASSIMRMA